MTATKTEVADVVTLMTVTETDLPADAVLAAARDFSARRVDVFPAVAARHFTVHSVGDTSADVTEGARVGPVVFWERCAYDWSQPGVVIATVTDSNLYDEGSRWEITAVPTESGSRVDMTWTRRFRRNPLARVMGFMYRRTGERAFGKYAQDVITNLERLHAA